MPPSPKTARCFTRSARQVQGNVGAAEVNLTGEEIAEIEGRNTYEPELVMVV
jgi:aryl-alcohol dehydrogenase-like predicted oxidoreductase